ncbi:MAG: DNA-directed RNA polymerase subunit omega [Clostridiales bacterium]|nr:DNA-directed RNA polymerase subunit omega [Clostridiales bacterium]
MMNRPPIDELAEKTGGNKYKLSILMAKRAKELEKRGIEDDPNYENKKCIAAAADEIYNGKVLPSSNEQ